jgi:ribonucleoside-diphosphate reductase subunit M1
VEERLVKCIDFQKLGTISREVTKNLNQVIKHSLCPLDEYDEETGEIIKGKINIANNIHRPLGIGVSGLAEMLFKIDIAFTDQIVIVLNKMIFACMYFNCLVQSVQEAINDGKHDSFDGSPFSKGKLQFDLHMDRYKRLEKRDGPSKVRTEEDMTPIDPSAWKQVSTKLYKMIEGKSTVIDTIKPTWDDLKRCIIKYGTRNCLLLALMPTATSSQIIKNTETVEAPQSNLYSRKVLKGSYTVINEYMVNDLEEIKIWNENCMEFLQVCQGSISNLLDWVRFNPDLFPNFDPVNVKRLEHIIEKYKTMWELSAKLFIRLAADRGIYIDQSQSMNIYIADATDEKLRALPIHTEKMGLKTGMYYLRQKTQSDTIQFTINPQLVQRIKDRYKLKDSKKMICNETVCTSCQ